MNLKTIKSFYTPGIISLFILPVFCLVFIQKSNYFKKYYAFDIFLPPPNKSILKNPPKIFDFKTPIRNYHSIYLNGNDRDSKFKLYYAQDLIRKIVTEHDSINGIVIHFTNKTEYWAFVKAIDICKIEKIISYAILNDNLLVHDKKYI